MLYFSTKVLKECGVRFIFRYLLFDDLLFTISILRDFASLLELPQMTTRLPSRSPCVSVFANGHVQPVVLVFVINHQVSL